MIDENLIREHLALERTKLANERTLLSYIRSSLYLFIGGLAILQIKEYAHVQWLGYLSLVICVIFISIGVYRYIHLNRKLHKLLRTEKNDASRDEEFEPDL
ncbi:putative membrane protein [Gillisia sp. Hel_I_86]|nr:putative membrane protein [Gillisia sp. Hel_I_86]